MTAKKKTIEDEAQELLDSTLHSIKVREAARILTELSNLKHEYEKQKRFLEEKLAGVDSIRVNSFGDGVESYGRCSSSGFVNKNIW